MDWFLKLIEVDGLNYVYDARTNLIFKINREVDDLDSLAQEVNDKYRQKFGDAFNEQDLEIKQMKFPVEKNKIIDTLENEMKELLFEITEGCNFRCGYCIYSGKYRFERTHLNVEMSEDVAKRAVDLFFEHNEKSNPVYISFYGGEPLLSFNLIQNIITYAKEKQDDKSIIFGMTTNGSLLTSEKFNFIVENDFNLLVSLDGPQEIHDRDRKYPDGSGTYEELMNNLQNLKDYNPDYYKGIGFLPTITDPMELPKFVEFFRTNQLVKDHRVMPSFVKSFDTDMPIVSNPEEELDKMWLNLMNEHATSISQKGNYSALLQRLFDLDLKSTYEREMNFIGSDIMLKGPCVPGARKIFVNPSGDIRICERVGNAFKIGDVYNGINYNEIFSLVDDYVELGQEDCPKCWAVRLCKPCFSYFRKNNKLDLDRKREVCTSLEESISRALYIYTKVFNQSPDNLQEYFQNY